MFSWPLSSNTLEKNTGLFNLITFSGEAQRFLNGKALFKLDGLKKENVDYYQLFGNDDWTVSFYFEAFLGMEEGVKYPLFTIVPRDLSDSIYYGLDCTNIGLKIVFDVANGIEVYYGDKDGSTPEPIFTYDLSGSSGSGGGLIPGVDVGDGEGSPPSASYESYRRRKIELSMHNYADNNILSFYVDDRYVDSGANYLSTDFDFVTGTDLGIGGCRHYDFDFLENTQDGYDYFIGRIWDVNVYRYFRTVEQESVVFERYTPKLAYGVQTITPDTRTLFIKGTATSLSEAYRELFIYGTTLSSDYETTTLYEHGVIDPGFDANFGDERTLIITGYESSTDTRTLFIQGASFESSYTLFLAANVLDITDELELFVRGSTNDEFAGGTDLYIDAKYWTENPLFIQNDEINESITQIPLYINSDTITIDQRPLFLQQDSLVELFYKPAYIRGDGTFSGSSQYSLGVPLFMEGDGEDFIVPPPDVFAITQTESTSLFIQGISSTELVTTLVIPKADDPPETRFLYINGF